MEITASTQDEAFIAAVDAVQQWLTSKDLEDVQSECRSTTFRVVILCICPTGPMVIPAAV